MSSTRTSTEEEQHGMQSSRPRPPQTPSANKAFSSTRAIWPSSGSTCRARSPSSPRTEQNRRCRDELEPSDSVSSSVAQGGLHRRADVSEFTKSRRPKKKNKKAPKGQETSASASRRVPSLPKLPADDRAQSTAQSRRTDARLPLVRLPRLSDSPKRSGLPEQLGILPAWGGTTSCPAPDRATARST